MNVDWKAEAERLDRLADEWMVKAVTAAGKVVDARKALEMTNDELLLRRSLGVGDRNIFEARTRMVLERIDAARAVLDRPVSPVTASREEGK